MGATRRAARNGGDKSGKERGGEGGQREGLTLFAVAFVRLERVEEDAIDHVKVLVVELVCFLGRGLVCVRVCVCVCVSGSAIEVASKRASEQRRGVKRVNGREEERKSG